jgi:hypothetical protein
MFYYRVLTLLLLVLMKCMIRLLLDVFTFIIAYTVIMFDVNYFYFCYNALVVSIKVAV